MKDDLGNRMKTNFEDRTRYFLPRRTYTIIRCDGKAFHTYCSGMKRPYDEYFMKIMNLTTKYLCENIQGCQFGYVQSDEMSLLLTDFATITTDAWFDGNIQKMCSVSASIASSVFNHLALAIKCSNDEFDRALDIITNHNIAFFDSRVFTIPDPTEVENYFIWRQKDAVRNSIQMTAQSLYSHKELHGKNTSELQEMCFQKRTNWNDMPDGFKRGRLVSKTRFDDEGLDILEDDPSYNKWVIQDSFDFLKEREKLTWLIPKIT